MSERIQIIYVIDVLDTDLAGTENQLIKLIKGLDKTRFEVHLLCFQDHPWFQANRASLGCDTMVIDIHKFKHLSTYWNILRLIGYFRRKRPNIVHTFFPVANIVAVIAARLAGVRSVISSRRDYGEWMSSHYLAMTKLANRCARKIVANSDSVKTLTIAAEGVKPEKIEVIYNGIDSKAFDALSVDWALKQELNITPTNKVVGIVANFRPMKRHDTFLLAAREVLKHRDDVDFLLVGSGGSAESDVLALGRELGIAERLHFVGAQAGVLPYLSIMDIGVNCSEREGFSNAVMEYMAAGVPCIASQSGGNPDLVTHNQNGLTFPTGDYRALASTIESLLENEALRQEFRLAAKTQVITKLALTTMLENYEQLYARLPTGNKDELWVHKKI